MKNSYEVIIVGSGPSGSTVGLELAKSGFEVLVLEESKENVSEDLHHTASEALAHYRNGGLAVTLGATPMSFIDPCAIGGGSQVNSGIYHRAPQYIEEFLEKNVGVSSNQIQEIYQINESSIGVTNPPLEPVASLLELSSSRMGWKSSQVKTWRTYDSDSLQIKRNTMKKTLLKEFEEIGGSLVSGKKVIRFEKKSEGWRVTVLDLHPKNPEKRELYCTYLFICAGALQSPKLLHRSGQISGNRFPIRTHPMIRTSYKFPFDVRQRVEDIPSFQVIEFLPRMVLGCSLTTPSQIALWHGPQVLSKWIHELSKIQTMYTLITSSRLAHLHVLPGGTSFISYRMSSKDKKALLLGQKRLNNLAGEAGAISRVANNTTGPSIEVNFSSKEWGLEERVQFEVKNSRISTIHLYGSLPLGEFANSSPVGSNGMVKKMKNLYVLDSSIIPKAIGVNPQGTTMLISRLLIRQFIGTSKR